MSQHTITIKLKLVKLKDGKADKAEKAEKLDEEQIVAFREVRERYRQACNYVSERIFNEGLELKFASLCHVLYHETKDRFELKAQMTDSVIKTVLARYKAVATQLKKKTFRLPDGKGGAVVVQKSIHWLTRPIHFKHPQCDLVHGRDYSFVENGKKLSINTLKKKEEEEKEKGKGKEKKSNKRIKVDFIAKHWDKFLDGAYKLGTAKLIEANNDWYLYIPVTIKVEDFNPKKFLHCVGIDRGLRFVIVFYDEQGRTFFYSGKEILRRLRKFKRRRESLQRKNTKSAKRRAKALSRRENRWMTDFNHRLSKTLVEMYGEDTLFVLEDLTGISFDEENLSRSAQQNYELRTWSFYQFEQFLTYKARAKRSAVKTVSPKFTSQRCPKCGDIRPENRDRKNHFFCCCGDNCGFKSNDDRTAAMNLKELGDRFLKGEKNPHF